jgi:membrane protein YdbS with pleckstrin-like domain
MQKRKYLLKVRRSRKTYFLLYLMIVLIISLIGYLYYEGYSISSFALIISFLFIFLIIKFTELHRFKDWWAITPTSIIQSTGIFNKNVRDIDFSSISDLDLDQSFFKRILNYGNVNVRLFLNETSIKIIDINKPEEFIEELQRIISMNRSTRNGLRQI